MIDLKKEEKRKEIWEKRKEVAGPLWRRDGRPFMVDLGFKG